MTDEHNLPVPDDAPWLNLSPQEIEELRKSKRELAAYATQKLRKLKMNNIAQKCVSAARNVAEGSPTLGKLIREGHNDPMTTRVRYEYAAVLRTLAEELGYNNFNIDGDHGILVINVRDVLYIIEVLEEMK